MVFGNNLFVNSGRCIYEHYIDENYIIMTVIMGNTVFVAISSLELYYNDAFLYRIMCISIGMILEIRCHTDLHLARTVRKRKKYI